MPNVYSVMIILDQGLFSIDLVKKDSGGIIFLLIPPQK